MKNRGWGYILFVLSLTFATPGGWAQSSPANGSVPASPDRKTASCAAAPGVVLLAQNSVFPAFHPSEELVQARAKNVGQAARAARSADLSPVPGRMDRLAATAENQVALSLANQRVTGARPDACDPPPPAKSVFAATDALVFHWTSVSGVSQGDVILWEWIKPDGSVFTRQRLILDVSGDVCFWSGIAIAGDLPATLPGNWAVRVLYNGAELLTANFTIIVAGPTGGKLCGRNLTSFYVGMHSLGFFFARASFNLGRSLDAAWVAQMRIDLGSASDGVVSMSPCLSFDLTRFSGLAAALPGMSGDDALQAAQGLIQDLTQAVRQAALTCDFGVNIGSLLQAGLNFGIAEALATFYPCNAPLPPDTAAQISLNLAAGAVNLRNYGACIASFDFGVFQNMRVGAPFTALESYVSLIGLRERVMVALLSSDCCCTCPALPSTTTGTVAGVVRNAGNGQPISGATISVANTSLTTSSKSDGTYTLNNVPSGSQTLNASSSGFVSAQVSVSVVAGQTLTQDISLSPATTGLGAVTGTVRNASNGQPISGATIAVAGTSLTTTSGSDGAYTLNNVPAGSRTLNASASGFISTQVAVNVTAGQSLTQNLSLSPVLQVGEIRITLNWNKDATGRPDDLDMHLLGPNPDGSSCFHVYYSSLGSLTSSPFVRLEVDNIQLSGHPPTETTRLSRLTPGTYRFYVHNYRGETEDGIAQSRATVQVFGSGGLLFTAAAPAGSGRDWTVFSLNGQSGAITQVNQYGPAPTSLPCR
ncbi:MAG: carboxypeptidase-like regulatory domain-containing protein [Acidobacteria bacterium]|nr:carboxypeptidase-like regulatory domain-containing protein [Acidobacteriota bacterium]